MLTILAALVVLVPLLMVQVGIFTNMPLLQGYPDLILLAVLAWALQPSVRRAWQWSVIGGILMMLASATPPGVYLVAYALSVGFVSLLRRLVWRIPFLTMWVATIAGSFLTHGLSFFVLQLSGRELPIGFAFWTIILPSVFYNLLMALPIYALVGEIARWTYPQEPLYEP
ncbi:MAG: hypothetical protein RML93_03795 [Anaerolineales bacterium]|nr:hypothetical protein [Anaerolineales bacterium]MCS7248107.1 hypothetical protein [Anaerolineales bacterium]MDW8161919.1 hypothetical protein [Anaerolineales bacterium]MDW8446399.1 hypothetical protein [Anaerolineales bacterium]